jgi:protein-S-isoprenylcysteine O-methyltransferase Ste14
VVSEQEIHRWVAWGIIATGVLVFSSLFFVTAPYGRHERKGWGPAMPTRWAWVIMESPAVIAFAGIYLLGQHRFSVAPLVLLGLWQLHYVNRTFVFPFRLKVEGKTTPIAVAAMAIVFNLFNAYVNARQISHLGSYEVSWLTDPRFLVGVAMFLAGRHINVEADRRLVALREEGEGYRIPRGWLYRYISCPNYFGEIIEWLGWAVATWSLAGASFAIFTIANLAPRAIAHHRWYREKFPDYPTERKALVPFLV